jgi:hypothetical protein
MGRTLTHRLRHFNTTRERRENITSVIHNDGPESETSRTAVSAFDRNRKAIMSDASRPRDFTYVISVDKRARAA